jgi:UTP--glucose-1-phosphate uridylyltransferase
METEGMELEIIINPKTTDDGQAVIQVRTYLFRVLVGVSG